MCLAIVQPVGSTIPIPHLQQGWVHNPDGAGYAFVKDDEVVVKKGYSKLKEFLKDYTADVRDNEGSAFLLHFRIRTMGDRSDENTHPFIIPGGAMIHNGSLTGTAAKYNEGPSDTSAFASKFGSHLNYDFVYNKAKELGDAIGKYNKLAMLYNTNRYVIVNEEEGVWQDRVWYSNSSYVRYGGSVDYPYMGDDE